MKIRIKKDLDWEETETSATEKRSSNTSAITPQFFSIIIPKC